MRGFLFEVNKIKNMKINNLLYINNRESMQRSGIHWS